MKTPLGIGIIGAGGITAKMHLPEFELEQERCRVVLISGRHETRLKLLCDRFAIPKFTTDYEDVIADEDVEAVVVATPHPQHVAWGIKALEAGKHVLMQKPLCGDIAEANAFVAAAEHTRRTVMVLPHLSPAAYAVWKGVRAGTVGRISGARARMSHGGPEVYYREVRALFGEAADEDLWFFDAKRAGVGALFDMGIYAVAHLVALLGSVRRVHGAIGTFDKPTTLEDHAALVLEMANGALAIAETSWCDPARTWEFSVHGTAGSYRAPGRAGAAVTLSIPLAQDSDHSAVEDRDVSPDESLGSAGAHFLDCVEQSIQPPVSHARAARHITEVLLAGLAAGRTGIAVGVHSSAD